MLINEKIISQYVLEENDIIEITTDGNSAYVSVTCKDNRLIIEENKKPINSN